MTADKLLGIGVGPGGAEMLTREAREAMEGAQCVYAARRHAHFAPPKRLRALEPLGADREAGRGVAVLVGRMVWRTRDGRERRREDIGMMHGGDVWQGSSPSSWLDFSANLRPEGTPSWAREAMARAIDEARYYPDVDMRAAKAGLAAYAGVRAECLVPFSGGIAAIEAVCRAGSGRVLVAETTFGEYARRALACGRETVRGLEGMRAGDTAFLGNPNNPTGEARDREDVLRLYARAKAARAELVVDEAFVDYCPEVSVRDEASRARGLIVVGSLTKILCVPGARLGYLVAEAGTARSLAEASAPWGLNAFAVAVARELPGHLEELRTDARLNVQRRARFAAALEALGARVYPSRANFLLADFAQSIGLFPRGMTRPAFLHIARASGPCGSADGDKASAYFRAE